MGALLGRDRNGHKDEYVGRTIHIHGKSYKFQKRLGEGGFGNPCIYKNVDIIYRTLLSKQQGAVYKGIGPGNEPVAIKIIDGRKDPAHAQQIIESYHNEVQNLNRLREQSRHVVEIHDFHYDHRTSRGYIVMELGQENLSKLIKELQRINRSADPGIDAGMVKEFWRQTVSIIHTLHSNGVIHMDLKPDNLILFHDTLKIGDLGISKVADVFGPAAGGTPQFSAPEMMLDSSGSFRMYDPKADVWSLGAILYYMVYGQPPQYHHLAANPPPGMHPHPDPHLNDILRHTLVIDPKRRFNVHQVRAHPYTRL